MKIVILAWAMAFSGFAKASDQCAVVDAGGPNSFVVSAKVSEGLLEGIRRTNWSNEMVEKANNISDHEDAIPSKVTSEGIQYEARLICTKGASGVSCAVEGRSAIDDLARAVTENCGGKFRLHRDLRKQMNGICQLTQRK